MRFPLSYRCLALAVSAVGLGGCGREEGVSGNVARVGDWALSQERLTDLLVLAQPLPLDSATVAGLLEHWVSVAALSQRMAAGVDLLGPEAQEASLWLEAREATLDAERRDRLARDIAATPHQVAEAFQGDSLLLLAQILRRVSPGASGAERALQKRTAQGILDRLRSGGGWAEALEGSEDAETRGSSGVMGLFRPNEVPATLRPAAERLLPGQVSAVIEGIDGFRILYRPGFADVSTLFTRLLTDRRMAELDAASGQALLDSMSVRIAPEAAPTVSAWASSRPPYRDDESSPLATWSGGSLPATVVARHVAALPDEARLRLASASEGAIHELLMGLAVREARLQQARQRGIDFDDRSALEEMHRKDVEDWRASLATPDGSFTREGVDAYMEGIVARRVPALLVPPLLAAWLLEPLDWSKDPVASRNAIESARRLISASGGRP